MGDTGEAIRTFVVEQLSERLGQLGISPGELSPDENLFGMGVLDSIQFMNVLAAIEQRYGVQISFESVDPESLGTLNGLARAVADLLHE